MKKIMIAFMFVSLITSCINDVKKEEIVVVKETTKKATYLIKTNTAEFNFLFDQLISFKDDELFITNGFGNGSFYNKWMDQVNNHVDMPKPNWDFKDKLAFRELVVLGMEYVESKGKETEYTKIFRREYKKPLKKVVVSKPKVKKKAVSMLDAYVGSKWQVVSIYGKPGKPLYTLYYELAKDDEGFYFIYKENSTLIYRLETNGDTFYRPEMYTMHGNYFEINNGMLEFWDEAGKIDTDVITKVK